MKIVNVGYEIIQGEFGQETVENYILFDNGFKLTSKHDRDCCESVYADFQHMQVMGVRDENYVDSNDLDFFTRILDSIVPIDDLGFYIVTKQGICLLVSCYNVQNGYYSSDLRLEYMGKVRDISPCVPKNCEYTTEIMKAKNDEKIEYLKKGEDWRYRQKEEEE